MARDGGRQRQSDGTRRKAATPVRWHATEGGKTGHAGSKRALVPRRARALPAADLWARQACRGALPPSSQS
eukprot:6002992-Prymnesium_polylepis.1